MTTTPILMDSMNVDFRDALRPPQDHDDRINISGDEFLDLLSSFNMCGRWLFDVETGETIWSEDVYAIHNMIYTPGSVNIDVAKRQYHADDQDYLCQMVQDAVTNESGFHFVLRIKAKRDRYKLVRSVGKYRKLQNGKGQIIGAFWELPPSIRMVGAALGIH